MVRNCRCVESFPLTATVASAVMFILFINTFYCSSLYGSFWSDNVRQLSPTLLKHQLREEWCWLFQYTSRDLIVQFMTDCWSCSGGLWWPNILLGHFYLGGGVPLICLVSCLNDVDMEKEGWEMPRKNPQSVFSHLATQIVLAVRRLFSKLILKIRVYTWSEFLDLTGQKVSINFHVNINLWYELRLALLSELLLKKLIGTFWRN